jgi:hypothetical protein
MAVKTTALQVQRNQVRQRLRQFSRRSASSNATSIFPGLFHQAAYGIEAVRMVSVAAGTIRPHQIRLRHGFHLDSSSKVFLRRGSTARAGQRVQDGIVVGTGLGLAKTSLLAKIQHLSSIACAFIGASVCLTWRVAATTSTYYHCFTPQLAVHELKEFSAPAA